ncbi:NAD-dependent succinate-semialdehyde dehydrogenase [Paractinoplanes lichenicola]|uniref:NAD-dependent succinate-semialdehyde dehydrogenase n=1 Tax=Paractinoplanes lichenicola TaxID=2802976 RepID=A0ABS1VML7_9ACTN|nr:NAD-dependent succinate-semialdehyde dehydrogenase [Actinoplanes lichenicola]MBL7255983.1 NAD-dependent succinate-semialdehyde dehydrogenase [Actinoplanes lichenicola]
MNAVPTRLLIGGQWRPATDGAEFPVRNPADGSLLASVADATADDGVAALDAAVAAAAEWAATAPRTRGELLRAAFDALQQRREEFATVMTAEMGKPYAEALGEVTYGGEFLRWFAEEAPRVAGRYGPNPEGTGLMMVSHRPVGPSYLITPWNFPLAMATRKIAPALAAGCTVVIKPAEQTPLTTLLFAQLLTEVGVPPGVVNVVPTSAPVLISERLITDPRLRKLSFTGSTAVGRSLLAQAAGGVLRTSMELGGNAPFLVFDDADLDAAVAGALQAKFRNIGQACTAANRFLVHEPIAGEFTQRLTAAVKELTAETIGPLIDQRAVDGVGKLVDDAVTRGARLEIGGRAVEGPGSFYEPTVLSGVAPGSRLLREEIFGPVVAIVPFTDEDEAVRLANDTEYGLVAYAYTRDLARAHRLIDRLETGMFGLNAGVVSNAAAPFGGVKQSGLGREGGIEGIHEYLTTTYALLCR